MVELVAVLLFVVAPIVLWLYAWFHTAPKDRNPNKKGLV